MVERIRTLLESRQLTPTQFADLIGVARPIISHVLSGRNKPSLDVVQRILAALPDLSMAWLLNGTEPMLTTAREAAPEAAPAMPAPRPAGPAASPLLVAPPQPVAPAQSRTPVVPAKYRQASTSQIDNSGMVSSEQAWAAVPTPVSPGPPSVAPAPISASPVPVARPANPIPSRPPMPRRFPVKPPVAELPVSAAAAPEVASAPVPPVPAGIPVPVASVVPLPVAPIEPAAVAVPMVESIVKEGVANMPATPVEPLVTVGASQAAEAASVGLSGAEAVTLAPVPLGTATPPAGIPVSAPAPVTMAGPVPSAAPTLASDMATALFTGAEKPIRRIVIFYRDGSFADYQPE